MAGPGNDEIWAGKGSDRILGGSGNDYIDGGGGNDTILGQADYDVLYGVNGNDTIDGGTGRDYIDGGAGNDTLQGGAGRDVVSGGLGNDVITGGADSDAIVTAGGDDKVNDGIGANIVYAKSSDDVRINAVSRRIPMAPAGTLGNSVTIDGRDRYRQRRESDLETLRYIPVGRKALGSLDDSMHRTTLTWAVVTTCRSQRSLLNRRTARGMMLQYMQALPTASIMTKHKMRRIGGPRRL
jgi:hypothetical protein